MIWRSPVARGCELLVCGWRELNLRPNGGPSSGIVDINVVPVVECDHQYPSAGTGRPKSCGTWSRSATVYVANQDNEGSGGDRLGTIRVQPGPRRASCW